MRVTILGVKRSEYKKDNQMRVGFNYYGAKEFTRYEQENAECEGQAVISEWSNTDFGIHPGDVVDFIYEPGFQDKATLVDVQIVSIADNPYTEGKEKPADDKKSKGTS